jgi:hypothetical protein
MVRMLFPRLVASADLLPPSRWLRQLGPLRGVRVAFLQPIVRRSQSATRKGPLERNEEVNANQCLLRPLIKPCISSYVVSELAASLLHMMAKRQLSTVASCRPDAGGPKRRGAAQLSADRPSPTMNLALGHRLATCLRFLWAVRQRRIKIYGIQLEGLE